MKKAVLLFACFCLMGSLSACEPPDWAVADQYNPLELELQLSEGEDIWICSQSEDALLISVGRRNGNMTGPLESTESLAVYDCGTGKATKEVALETDAYITNAVLYQDGIVYVDYENAMADTSWAIRSTNGAETAVLAEGTASSYEWIPSLAVCGDRLLYLWEEPDKESIGIYEIADGKSQKLFGVDGYTLSSGDLCCNGQTYCFAAAKETDEFATIFIGDTQGISYEYKLDNKITSFAIAHGAVVVGVGKEETREFYVVSIDLETFESSVFKVDRPLWRMKGGGSDTCLCVDNNFDLYEIRLGEKRLRKLETPSDSYVFQTAAVVIHPAVDGRYLLRYDVPNEKSLLYFLRVGTGEEPTEVS